MVAMLEIAFLIIVVMLGLWWFVRTNGVYRANRHGTRSSYVDLHEGVDPKNRYDPPNHGGDPGGAAW